jgi:hypothetical protein
MTEWWQYALLLAVMWIGEMVILLITYLWVIPWMDRRWPD